MPPQSAWVLREDVLARLAGKASHCPSYVSLGWALHLWDIEDREPALGEVALDLTAAGRRVFNTRHHGGHRRVLATLDVGRRLAAGLRLFSREGYLESMSGQSSVPAKCIRTTAERAWIRWTWWVSRGIGQGGSLVGGMREGDQGRRERPIFPKASPG